MRSYNLGNPELDASVRALVAAASENLERDLIEEMIVTVLKLYRDGSNRGDLKLINTALKEMRFSNLVFSRHPEPKVTIYGSARLGEDDPNFEITERFASLMVEKGWGVITGAGPGIMEAGSKGAGPDHSYGVNIRLPFEGDSNHYLLPERTVNFKYFFTRKLGFVKESHAFVILPGGFGTLDEAFELLTLVQTGKSDLHPIVFLEAPGTDYWAPIIEFMRDVQVARGLISEADLNLFRFTTSAEEARDEVSGFYANYHSTRYVEGTLVIRMSRTPDKGLLARLNEDFADIVVTGQIEVIEPTEAEIRDQDALDMARIAFVFDRRGFGRLRSLVDELNGIVTAPEALRLPSPMGEEQAERPW